MRKPIIVTGLDIGSTKVAAVTAEISNESFRILGHASMPAKGVSKGVIVDLNESVNIVSDVLAKVQKKTLKKPGDIYVNINGTHVKGARSRGMVPISLRGREVVIGDVRKCIDVAGTIHLPLEREIIYRSVLRFSIDDQPWIKNAVGLYASRLGCEVYIITADVNHIQNLYKCVNNAGHEVKEIVFTGIADGLSLLDKEQRRDGAMLVDIGGSLLTMSLFSEGSLYDFAVIPLDSHIAKENMRDNAELSNAMAVISSKLQDFLSIGGNVGAIYITGGMVFMDGMNEYIEERLGRPVKMAVTKDIIGGISGVDSIKLATAIGLARYASEKREIFKNSAKNLLQQVSAKVVDIFNNYF